MKIARTGNPPIRHLPGGIDSPPKDIHVLGFFQKRFIELAEVLLSPQIIRTLVFRIIKVFEDMSQVELSKGRWEEIKKLQIQPALAKIT